MQDESSSVLRYPNARQCLTLLAFVSLQISANLSEKAQSWPVAHMVHQRPTPAITLQRRSNSRNTWHHACTHSTLMQCGCTFC